MNLGGFVLAYHGCDRTVAERVLSGADDVRPSTNDYDWLGPGAYFWENSARRALTWAKFLRDSPAYSRQRISEPAVVGAIVDPGNCLDLTEAGGLAVVRRAYEEIASLFEGSGALLPRNEPGFIGDADLVKRRLDCAVLSFVHDSRDAEAIPAFDTVRAVFAEGAPLYPGAGFAARTHLQWCVREPTRSVRGYFRPQPELEE